jgi:hypothetical protein
MLEWIPAICTVGAAVSFGYFMTKYIVIKGTKEMSIFDRRDKRWGLDRDERSSGEKVDTERRLQELDRIKEQANRELQQANSEKFAAQLEADKLIAAAKEAAKKLLEEAEEKAEEIKEEKREKAKIKNERKLIT